MMNFKHYLQYHRGDLSGMKPGIDPDFEALDAWRKKDRAGEIHRLRDFPWYRTGYITEKEDLWNIFGDSAEEQAEKEAFFSGGQDRYSYRTFGTSILLSPGLRAAIDAMPGEFIYLHTDYNAEEEFIGIIALLKMEDRCEPSASHGFSDGVHIREFLSSEAVVEFLEQEYPALKTYHQIPSPEEILSAGFITVDYLRTQMMKEKLTTLPIRLGDTGLSTELPVTLERDEINCDGYQVQIKGTPVEEWLKELPDQDAPVICEVVGMQSLLLRI